MYPINKRDILGVLANHEGLLLYFRDTAKLQFG